MVCTQNLLRLLTLIALLVTPILCAATSCSCTGGQSGTRLVWADASYYNQPCQTSGIAALLPKCELFYFTGKRFTTPSSCGGEEPTCYIEVQRGAGKAYVIDHACSTATSNLGRPGNPACPAPGGLVQTVPGVLQ